MLDSGLLRLDSGLLGLPGLDSCFLGAPGLDSVLLGSPGLDTSLLESPGMGVVLNGFWPRGVTGVGSRLLGSPKTSIWSTRSHA